jgi:IclR family acetate operon transcriptional repressor
MPVKRSQSASRTLSVLEEIARRQPIGVSDLSRVMGADKSAVQRAIMTLADQGWVQAAGGAPTRWQLTHRIHQVAGLSNSRNDLRRRALPALEALRDATGETTLLSVPHERQFLVIEVVESRQVLRAAPHVGMDVPVRGSATALVVLPHLSLARQTELLRAAPDEALRASFAAALARGYAACADTIVAGSTNIGAAILDIDGSPLGALVVSAPSERAGPEETRRMGEAVAEAARRLSRRPASPTLQQQETTPA